MITDIHCHFVPDEFFAFASARDEFAIKVKRREGDLVDLDIRGMHFGLNTTFFDMKKQVERMARDGVERTILSQATPFIDYNLDARVAVEAARVFNDCLASTIAPDKARFGGWALLPMQDPAAAAQELRRCVRDQGFVGGHIASNVRGV
jgi:aminocarboxymuconate-semialdehyde decarboxylase